MRNSNQQRITGRPSLALIAFSALTAALFLQSPAVAGNAWAEPTLDESAIRMGGRTFATWTDYFGSEYFEQNGKRCGKPASVLTAARIADPSDCTYTFTNPSGDYDTTTRFRVPVVFHIIEHSNGNGQISDALVNSQVDILNEDFQAIASTPGAPGYDAGIEFVLADTDPGGSPTTGITRTENNTWFADGGNYWDTLAWDTSRYMNVYTNEAGGNLGYVPDLPQGGIAGDNSDRVVILWNTIGRDAPAGPPFDQGRTLTHEVGHYLGLEHTFTGGCAAGSSPGCYTSGDLICDTNSEADSTDGCPGSQSTCGSADPVHNYMDYSDDTCMDNFTDEQSHRMRCSLLNYRPDLYGLAVPPVCGNDSAEPGEDCDGTDDAACAGLCTVGCTCPAPVCGNDLIELGEECDGIDPGTCPTGNCDPDCTCEDPICGNDITETGETCDGTDDSACAGLCEAGCVCPATCNADDLSLRKVKIDADKLLLKGELLNFTGTYDGLDPREEFQVVFTQGTDVVTVSVPALDAGWEKSKPERGKYSWKGTSGGLLKVKLKDKTLKRGVWQVRLKGKEVPGAGAIDAIFDFVDIEVTMEGVCGAGEY